MLFASTVFIFAFLPTVLLLYYVVLKKFRTAQNILLLVASLLFYAWGEPKYVLIMILSIIVNYLFGLLVDKFRASKTKSRLVIALTVVFNLGVLYIFKYLMFTIENINSITGLHLSVPNIVLPIGISFFTFQAMSYVIDVYREKGEAQKNPLNVGLYISFFPQLIAGPIVRYETVAYQIKHREESFEKFSEGVCRFIIGLAKKVLLANTMAVVADYAFDMPNSELTVVMAWVGAIAYTFQIFFDFGGYSDMAIGLGKMFGFEFLENFNYPYISLSVSEFWRRWHMSLGTWFRDYVYFPLGGSRVKSKARLVFNLFVVWSLTGIWHGANWTFLCWGLMYFVLLTIEKLIGWEKKYPYKMKILRRIYTLFFVVMGWVLFRADSIGDAGAYFATMFGGGNLIDDATIYYALNYIVYFVIAILVSTPIFKNISAKINGNNPVVVAVSTVGLFVLLVVSVSYIVKGAYNPFIYFNF
ncbi:MAG: MBOAT family protein [Ruminococcus sp.]|nr:MBOAT family protein [Ruminococcus sp.]